jgi:hypothetical protein
MSAHHSPGDWYINGPSAPTADSLEGGDYAIVAGGQIIAEVFYRSSPVHTHNAEAKAATAYQVAFENFGDARPEAVAHERAMRAASAAEAKARTVLAKATGAAA